jgi:hypothetical protein
MHPYFQFWDTKCIENSLHNIFIIIYCKEENEGYVY